jgi:hypothetical protein
MALVDGKVKGTLTHVGNSIDVAELLKKHLDLSRLKHNPDKKDNYRRINWMVNA